MLEIYLTTTLIFAYMTMSNLESLRIMPRKDVKSRGQFNKRINELEKDLIFSIFWPWLFLKKIRNEYKARKQN